MDAGAFRKNGSAPGGAPFSECFVAYIQMQEIFARKTSKLSIGTKSFRLRIHLLTGMKSDCVGSMLLLVFVPDVLDFQQQNADNAQAATAAPASPAVAVQSAKVSAEIQRTVDAVGPWDPNEGNHRFQSGRRHGRKKSLSTG